MYLRMVQNDRTNEDGAHMSGLHMIYTKRDLLRETLYELMIIIIVKPIEIFIYMYTIW